MKDLKETKITVIKGALLINSAYIYKKYKDICIVIVDMKSKRGDISYTGSEENECPSLGIEPNKDSVYLNPKCQETKVTQIVFKDFKKWNILMANVNKYSIYVCLEKGG